VPRRAARASLLPALLVALGAWACRQPEQPPVRPSPINPTNNRAALDPPADDDISDASITSDARATLDGGLTLDVGVPQSR
jgi:hypothetical protein